MLDQSIYFVSVLAPLSSLPQILQVWQGHQTAGISLVTWSAYAGINVLWIAYGIIHSENPITFGNVLMLACNAAVVVGVLLIR